MITILPTSDNLFYISCSDTLTTPPSDNYSIGTLSNILNDEPDNFSVRLSLADAYMEAGNIELSCQTRLDGVNTLLEALEVFEHQDNNEDIEFDMSNELNLVAVETLYLSALDHYNIGDYETSISFLEVASELDLEDHFEINILLAFAYASFGEEESLEYQLKSVTLPIDIMDILEEVAIHNTTKDNNHKDSNQYKIRLDSVDSHYINFLAPLQLSHQDLFN